MEPNDSFRSVDDSGFEVAAAVVAEPLPRDLVSALALVTFVNWSAPFVVAVAVALPNANFPTKNSLVDNRLQKLPHYPLGIYFPKDHLWHLQKQPLLDGGLCGIIVAVDVSGGVVDNGCFVCVA